MSKCTRRCYGELPEDLRVSDESLGPPPAWYNQLITPQPLNPMFIPYYVMSGLGDRETEVEVNPVEYIQELKANVEMPKNIPLVANRYTDINPLSPFFRRDIPKYGFGSLNVSSRKPLLLAAALVLAFLYLRNK